MVDGKLNIHKSNEHFHLEISQKSDELTIVK